MSTAANLNLYGSEGSHVAWHGDNEELFGLRAESKLIVSLSPAGLVRNSCGSLSPARAVRRVRVGLIMVTFWSWMVHARMNSFTARVLVLLGRNG